MNHSGKLDAPSTIYLIDDDSVGIQLISRALSGLSVRIEQFTSATEFLDCGEIGNRGCIVTDVMLPGITGLELLSILIQRGCRLPIVILTAHADIDMCRRALKAGAFDFVAKDGRLTNLVESVTEAIAQNERLVGSELHRDATLEKLASLTAKEAWVARLLGQGATLKQISKQMKITPQTASKHRASVFRKLRAENAVDVHQILAMAEQAAGT